MPPTEIQEVAQSIRRLHLEVTDRLARIEENTKTVRSELETHTQQDAEHFASLELGQKQLMIEREVAKRTAGRKGAISGATVTAVLVTIAETVRQLWRP